MSKEQWAKKDEDTHVKRAMGVRAFAKGRTKTPMSKEQWVSVLFSRAFPKKSNGCPCFCLQVEQENRLVA